MTEAKDNRRLRQEVLLKEYEVCQSEAVRADRAIWASTAVLFGISALGAGFAVQRLLGGPVRKATDDPIGWFTVDQWSTLAIAVVAIVALEMWVVLLDRAAFVRRIAYYRQSEVEKVLDMRRSRYVTFLDNPKEGVGESATGLDKEVRRELLKGFGDSPGRSPRATAGVKGLVLVLEVGWAAIVGLKLWPTMPTWLLLVGLTAGLVLIAIGALRNAVLHLVGATDWPRSVLAARRQARPRKFGEQHGA